MPTGTHASGSSAQYRLRTGSGVSEWMGEQALREAASSGVIGPTTPVQQAGRSEWIEARLVDGLSFEDSSDPPAAKRMPETTGSGHHVRFQTLREVLAAFLNSEIEIESADGRSMFPMRLAAVGHDHFEVDRESDRLRLFVPYGRVRLIGALESDNGSALNYRQGHRLRVTIDGPAPA